MVVDKWSVKVTVVEHLRRSENTNVFLSLLPNFANTSPHFCKFCPLTKSLCRRQGAKSDRTVEQVEQLVKKKRPVIRFEKTNAFFHPPAWLRRRCRPGQSWQRRGDNYRKRNNFFLDLHPVFTFSHHGDYKRASKSSYLVDWGEPVNFSAKEPILFVLPLVQTLFVPFHLEIGLKESKTAILFTSGSQQVFSLDHIVMKIGGRIL